MRLAATAVALVLALAPLANTAYAQGINLWADDAKPVDPDAEEKKAKIDKAYRDKVKNQPAQAPAANDPWGSVRASGTPQSKQTGSKNR